jgi:hypothetical protein
MAGPARRFLDWLGDVFMDSSKIGYKNLESGKYLEISSEEDVEVVDQERVPEKIRGSDQGVYSDNLDSVRSHVLEGKAPGQIASEAADNPYILSDVISDPGLVDADSPGNAVQAVAEANPGWASMNDVETISGEPDPGAVTGEGDTGESDTSTAPGVGEGEIDTGTGEVDIDTGSVGTGATGDADTGNGGLGDGSLGDGSL